MVTYHVSEGDYTIYCKYWNHQSRFAPKIISEVFILTFRYASAAVDQITLLVGYSARKETTHKPSKVATTKKHFLQCVCYWYNHVLLNVFYSMR